MKTNLKQLTKEELLLFVENLGQKPYRSRQIINWIYKKLATSINEMSDLSRNFRDELNEIAFVSNLNLLQKQVSNDGARKFLLELEDGETMESVLIPNIRGRNKFTLCISSQVGCALGCRFCMTGLLGLKRNLRTLCISSQVGCALGCRFCMTGLLGLKRNLRAYEIIDQIIIVNRLINLNSIIPAALAKRGTNGNFEISNIVFMGMGEPLNNFNEVCRALRNITELMGFSRRKITVSTAGIIPGIRKLADTGPAANIAVSLNAANDETRNRIMPINKKYHLKKLIKACKEFPLPPNRRITFEYVLLGGINDSGKDALLLVELIRGIKSKINLIPYNPVHISTGFKKPPESRVLEFQKVLRKAGLTVIIRKSKGADISAACGQLRAGYK
jgi:23S rRNA (adenine2503-C2)-methyltransferase